MHRTCSVVIIATKHIVETQLLQKLFKRIKKIKKYKVHDFLFIFRNLAMVLAHLLLNVEIKSNNISDPQWGCQSRHLLK